MIYFDSSALIKMIAPEPESQALSQWIRDRWEQPRVTSALSKVDVLRNFREQGPAAEDLASIVVSKLDTLPVQQEVLDSASELRADLGPVEAIHLASACGIRNEPVTYVSYDPALLEAAKEAGLATASPA
ncbi:type II toxin-antitoxin system VapC family toxin [Saccharopolyspora sp. TS4A08]|uniref:Type II toxin-antitoxin system VapC family toxin n=1 Tax=Saccharopolyspora ipomoeae TaxID=3042027 RepID=A0ABT6PKF4_9PSEU|nr:type II toxin-antitoxin system VapC family toxin [Saccharopolyspora sp. TS4A08]MDI2028480.1 type II toxin-antitoxin system VapC family toxin [Saccharopolyspora sp. TS4A08]